SGDVQDEGPGRKPASGTAHLCAQRRPVRCCHRPSGTRGQAGSRPGRQGGRAELVSARAELPGPAAEGTGGAPLCGAPPPPAARRLAGRPYALRPACLSRWLNAGVDPTQVAEWAGNMVEVLMRVYAKCIHGRDEINRKRIEDALRYDDGAPGDR